MKKIFSGIVMLLFVSAYAQNNAEAIQLEKKILEKAKDYSDPASVKNSMLKLIVLEGDKSQYKDSLALLYYAERKYGSCFVITQEILKNKPNDIKTLELQSFSLEAIGAYDKAAESFAKLFAQSNDNYHGFSLANLQYVLKRYPESFATIQKVEKLNDTGNYTVSYAINQNHNQEVELIAAIQYLKGLNAAELKQNPVAKTSFEKAITIQPDFVLAKEAIANLSAEKQ
ncbi:hypothetical protein [Namhaeicola litoreus]|uniref:Tetratricopeptide repeat protein n=1 Tax=Namhaeicola litoreus TaxID=1052145 RepID=A0ABW3Y3W7_9FLAO